VESSARRCSSQFLLMKRRVVAAFSQFHCVDVSIAQPELKKHSKKTQLKKKSRLRVNACAWLNNTQVSSVHIVVIDAAAAAAAAVAAASPLVA